MPIYIISRNKLAHRRIAYTTTKRAAWNKLQRERKAGHKAHAYTVKHI